jgi:hypothetical protein
MLAQEVLLSPGNPAAIPREKGLGQRFCVPAFRLVCLFQARDIIGKVQGRLKCEPAKTLQIVLML